VPECDDNEWARGKTWACEQALGAAWYYEQPNPDMHEVAMTSLRRLLASQGWIARMGWPEAQGCRLDRSRP
jgi:hypothetical protein